MNNARISDWLNEFEEVTQSYKEAFEKLDSIQLSWKPSGETWSVSEIIEHVMKVNISYFPIIEKLTSGTYKTPLLGKLPFIPGVLGNLIHNSVKPENRRKVQTMSIWKPSYSKADPFILDKFLTHQEILIKKISHCSPFLRKVIASPANRLIVYTLEKAIDIILDHEKRHFDQADALSDLMADIGIKEN
jgi:hypothetical protein